VQTHGSGEFPDYRAHKPPPTVEFALLLQTGVDRVNAGPAQYPAVSSRPA